jgi:ArsR family transcriptional regulator
MLSPSSVSQLAKLLGFLGNEQRLNILKAIAHDEKFAREISEEVGISRPLVNIYLKQFEKAGLVIGTNRISDDPPYIKRYYRAVPFELAVNLDLISKIQEGKKDGFQND